MSRRSSVLLRRPNVSQPSVLRSFRRRATAAVLLLVVAPLAMTGCSDDGIRSLGGGPVSANFQATAVPVTIAVTAGNGQAALVGAPLVTPISVAVRDRGGTGVPGVPVHFQLIGGRGTLTVESAVTDRTGVATTGLNIGSSGVVNGTATVVGFPDVTPAVFAVTGVEPAQPFAAVGTAAVTNSLNALRVAIGGVDNGGALPAQSSGRREINWDAVLLDGTDFGGNTTVILLNRTIGIPVSRFQARGVLFDRTTAVSGDGFASANGGVGGQLLAFSPNLIFAPFQDNNQVRVTFVRASTPSAAATAARVGAFGAVFLDVETAGASTVEFFNGLNSLGRIAAPVSGNAAPSFAGGLFTAGPVVTHVVLTTGNGTLFQFSGGIITPGPPDLTGLGAVDQVALDDFIYSEPQ